MEVYVVSKICDYEYFCTDVLFVTASEEIAKQYREKYNRKIDCWDNVVRDEITYCIYELETTLPTRR